MSQTSQSPNPAESVSEPVYVRLVPEEAEGPGETHIRPALRDLARTATQSLAHAGEWIGVSGPKATLLTRLTAGAVGLVLVSGITLLMCPADSTPQAAQTDEDVQLVEVMEVETVEAVTRPGKQVVHAHVDGPARRPVEPSVWQSAAARGAWLAGTIETE